MLLLLLASTFALSFAPLAQNDFEITLSEGKLDSTDVYKITLKVQPTEAKPPAATYKYHVFDKETGGEKLFDADVAAPLAQPAAQPEPESDTIDLATHFAKLSGLDKIFIEVYTTGDTPKKVSKNTLEVAFAAKATKVEAEEATGDKVKITFTLSAELTSLDFVFLTSPRLDALKVAKVGTVGHVYSVTAEKAKVVVGTPYGFFKDADTAKSTLPIFVPNEEAPALTFTHASATHAKVVLTPPSERQAWIQTGEEHVELKAADAQTDIKLAYAQLTKDSLVYYTKTVTPPADEDTEANADEEPVIVSIKGFIQLEKFTATLAWEPSPTPVPTMGTRTNDTPDDPVDEVDNTPKLKVTFDAAMKAKDVTYYIADKAADKHTLPDPPQIIFEPEKITGAAAVLVQIGTGDVVESFPFVLPNTTFKLSNKTATDTVQPVLVEMEKAGIYEVKPAGIVVVTSGTEDCSTGKYYPLVWSTIAADVGKATADVKIADWTSVKDKNVIAFVTSKHETGAIPEKPVRLSADFAVFKRETDPVTPPASAFARVASLMAALLSLIVLAF